MELLLPIYFENILYDNFECTKVLSIVGSNRISKRKDGRTIRGIIIIIMIAWITYFSNILYFSLSLGTGSIVVFNFA